MPSRIALLRCCTKFKTMNKLHLVTFIALIAATVLAIIGIALPTWLDGGSSNQGLWKYCTLLGCGDFKIKDQPDWFQATRAMALIGALALILAAIMSPCYFFSIWSGCPLSQGTMTHANAVLSFLAGLCLLISVIIYGDHYGKQDYGAGFALTVIAAGLAFLTTAMVCVMKKKGEVAG